MEKQRKWRIFEITGINPWEEKERSRDIVKRLFEELSGGLGLKIWWNFYKDLIRLGIYHGADAKINLDLVELEFNEIENPDSKDHPEDIVEEINWIKFNACLTAQLMDFRIPESRLAPSSIAYFIHLFMNSIGASYFTEARIYAWLTEMCFTGMENHEGEDEIG